ncbi:MAG: glycosyltransferase family 4 protein [Planctomycetes bacterium]|nr:glycosyltransferase family 4 protein [Planctomycetota bacterium]
MTALLANGLPERGYNVTILTLTGPEEPFYEVHPDVEIHPLSVHWGTDELWNTLVKNRAIRRALHTIAPDVLVGVMTECNVLGVLAARIAERMPFPVVVNEQVHPGLTNLRTLACAARIVTFPFADAVVTCSRGMAPWYERWLPSEKVHPIQNPVVLDDRLDDPEAERLARQMEDENWILTMGRLAHQKGYDMLIEAVGRLDEEVRQDWRIGILGEGELREDLQERIDREGLGGRISLLGRFSNPYPILRAGEMFVMSSRYEGFPNALTEGMACGLPAVSFDCPTGPGEIIRDGVDGLLVPPGDVDALAEALTDLMSDADRRKRMAERAPDVLERFGLETFLDRWEMLVRRVVGGTAVMSNDSSKF